MSTDVHALVKHLDSLAAARPAGVGVLDCVALAANAVTIVAGVIAIYIFIAKRRTISAAIKLLLGYARQQSLSRLASKLDRLGELNADIDGDRIKVVGIVHEIAGHLSGNKRLASQCPDLLAMAERLIQPKRTLTEALKKRFVSQAEETIRGLWVVDTTQDDGGTDE
jgi:hypothetical protein